MIEVRHREIKSKEKTIEMLHSCIDGVDMSIAKRVFMQNTNAMLDVMKGKLV